MSRILLLIPALVLMGSLDAKAQSPLDPAFAEQAASKKSYESVVVSFLRAAQQPVEPYLATVDALTKEIRSAAGESASPRARLASLREVLFTRWSLKSDANLTELDNLLPNRVLLGKRGYCLGLSLLILHIGEKLEWPLVSVWAPRHTFVRYRGAESHFNFETTLVGSIHNDEWYRRRFGMSKQARLIELDLRQLSAHILNNHGYVLLEHGQGELARTQFNDALRLFPGLVEARINLGVAAARSGQLAKALSHFDAAAKVWPGDPSIALNRIIALIPLGRAVEAAKLGESLLREHPGFKPAFDRLSHARRQMDRTKHWAAIQSLSNVLNRARVGESRRLPGLRGQYYGGRNFEKKILERVDRDLAFSWRWNSPATGVPRDNFSIRWNGYFEVSAADSYTFRAVCSDGVRVRVDGALVIDEWRIANDNFAEAVVDLSPGMHDIEIEYFESRGDAGVMLLLTAERQELVLELDKVFFHPAG